LISSSVNPAFSNNSICSFFVNAFNSFSVLGLFLASSTSLAISFSFSYLGLILSMTILPALFIGTSKNSGFLISNLFIRTSSEIS